MGRLNCLRLILQEMDPLKTIEEYEDALELEKSLCKELDLLLTEIKQRRSTMTDSEKKNYELLRDSIMVDVNTVRRRILSLSEEVNKLFREL